jgi:maltooligosyltrehalose trehalohydrolase
VVLERDKCLCVQRWCDVQKVRILLHFGRSPVSLRLPWSAGEWHKWLDSAEARWHGPGSSVDADIKSEGQVTLTLPPESLLVFAYTTES